MIERIESSSHFGKNETQVKTEKIFSSLVEQYSSTFGPPRSVGMKVLPPTEEVLQFIGGTSNPRVPRGKYYTEMKFAAERIPPKAKIRVKGVEVVGERIFLIAGDTSLVGPYDAESVYKPILAHEFIHSQVEPRILVEEQTPSLRPTDLYYAAPIHYVLGFKAVSVDLNKGVSHEITKQLDEYITQYLSMCLSGVFDNSSPILERMKHHGLGIDADSIIGAELLNKAFSKHGITPHLVENFHRTLDIKGFLKMLEGINKNLSRSILRAGIGSNSVQSLDKLRGLV